MLHYLFIGFKWILFALAIIVALKFAWLLLSSFCTAMGACLKGLFQPGFTSFVLIIALIVLILYCL